MSKRYCEQTVHEPKFKKGDLVRFTKRAQPESHFQIVESVDTNMFDSLYLVRGQWWSEGCFELYVS